MGISLCVCLYWCICMCVGSGAMNPVVKSHMFVQSEKGGYEYCWFCYRLIRVWMAKWWRVCCHWKHCANFCIWLLWVVCQCLRKELQWGKCWFLYVVFVGVTGDCGCRSRLFLWGVVGMRGQVECVLVYWVVPVGCGPLRWSCCIEVLGNRWYLLYRWLDVEGGSEVVSCRRLVFYKVLY